jgi:WD40 repeat protein
MDRVAPLLDECPSDKRRWEWHYLKRLAQTGHCTLACHADRVWGVAYSPDGSLLASASWDRTIQVSDVRSRKNPLTFIADTDRVWCVAYSPDGKWLASAGPDGVVKVWDARTGQQVHSLEGHTQEVRGLSFSPDSNKLASASHDQTVRIWDTATGRRPRVLNGHTCAVFSVAFHPDGSRLASSSIDGTTRICDLATGLPVQVLRGHRSWVRSLACGWVLVEDTDLASFMRVSFPHRERFERAYGKFIEALSSAGFRPKFGLRLGDELRAAGLQNVSLRRAAGLT